MPIQRLSLFGALPARHLETLVHALQSLTAESLLQFKTLTKVCKDDSAPQGNRPTNFLRIQRDVSSTSLSEQSTAVIEVVDTPLPSKRPLTSRFVHVVPCPYGDPVQLATSLGYTQTYAFFEQGYSLVIGSVSVRIYQIFRAVVPSQDQDDPPPQNQDDKNKDGEEKDNQLQGLTIGSGATWIVQTDVDVKTGVPEDVKRAQDDLLRLKKEVDGYVDLVPLADELR